MQTPGLITFLLLGRDTMIKATLNKGLLGLVVSES